MEGFNGRISEGTLHCFFGLSMHTEYVNNSGVTRAFKCIRFWGHLLRTDSFSFFFRLMCCNNDIFSLLWVLRLCFFRVLELRKNEKMMSQKYFLSFPYQKKAMIFSFMKYALCFVCLFVLPKFDGAVSFRRVVSSEDMTWCSLQHAHYGSCSL